MSPVSSAPFPAHGLPRSLRASGGSGCDGRHDPGVEIGRCEGLNLHLCIYIYWVLIYVFINLLSALKRALDMLKRIFTKLNCVFEVFPKTKVLGKASDPAYAKTRVFQKKASLTALTALQSCHRRQRRICSFTDDPQSVSHQFHYLGPSWRLSSHLFVQYDSLTSGGPSTGCAL
jgi:hypothetical protein